MGFPLVSAAAKVPVVFGIAIFNAVVVQALYFPLNKVLSK